MPSRYYKANISLSGETMIALAMQNTVIVITIIDDYPDNLW